jgi:N-acetylglucosamine malate deacetylase 1
MPEKNQEASKDTSKDPVIVLCAHSDDQVLFIGGTMAKYANEGRDVYCVVFSYGEKSHPWLQKREAAKMRVEESFEAGKILGMKETFFLGVEEGKFKEQISERKVYERLENMFKKYKPERIFIHSSDDPHPDHNVLHKFMMDFIKRVEYEGHVFSFDVWNPVNLKKRNLPKVIVDVSGTFKTKMEALQCFKSQWLAMIALKWKVYWNAITTGRSEGYKYAEVFYKVR